MIISEVCLEDRLCVPDVGGSGGVRTLLMVVLKLEYGDGTKHPDDGNDDHQFDQGKPFVVGDLPHPFQHTPTFLSMRTALAPFRPRRFPASCACLCIFLASPDLIPHSSGDSFPFPQGGR
jgi:hypothetical protein